MPPRGGNRRESEAREQPTGFNSCPREGAIRRKRRRQSRKQRFNSCPREGAIRESSRVTEEFVQFQLMPPRGGNPKSGRPKYRRSLQFQLMPPRGGNPAEKEGGAEHYGSFNSCPREGAIQKCCEINKNIGSFNSCPREGAISKSAQSSNDNATMFGQNRQLFAGFADNLFRAPLKTAPKMLFFCADPTGFCV